ncbi:cell division ATP-binding protein FtsE [Acaryochloris sp. CCMEE 5410]|uniref:cell division ATP-binding protein FtsE n=1 Tax=Acaryochloris sp. CCMEE 5410 TaxID=310037 RepID=UPI000248511B|nr:cell division ATP-binding protein FtsE [Acaryochloris sp. CCMEE 5410]KAI9131548.1 cell division ATP-binding protein FtsE [Acaryochloris sp. CCMEE 5410]
MTQATFSTPTMSSTFKRLKAQVDTPAHAHYTVQLKSVCKVYPQTRFSLLDINLTLKQGDFLFVTGASGAGKTTLMKLIYGAEQADRGEVRVVGTNVGLLKGNRLSHLRRKLGVVFQDYKLIPRWTVAENVAFVLRSQGVPKTEIDRRLYPTLKLVGLQQRADCFPSQLSGGEQQRASIARAIVGSPKLLLADEPTGNLDQDNALQVLGILKKLNSLGITVVVTTHDMGLIQTVKAPVAQLDQGRLQVVPAEQVI